MLMRSMGALSASLFVRTLLKPSSMAWFIASYFSALAIPRPRTAGAVAVIAVLGTPRRVDGKSSAVMPTIDSSWRAIQYRSWWMEGLANQKRFQASKLSTPQGVVEGLAFSG